MYRNRRLTSFTSERCNLKISSDGGSRGGVCSATGWSVWAVLVGEKGEELEERLLSKGGVWFEKGMPSLEVETRALVEALEHVISFLV